MKLQSLPTHTVFNQSIELSKRIGELIPGGVNSPFRSFTEVGGHTIFFDKAHGAHLTDVDGNHYIDYLGAWGPAILGHAAPQIVSAIQNAIATGAVTGAPHLLELEMAEMLVSLFAGLDKVRFVNSGTEAVMSAIRLARGYTGRSHIIMFEGCYHGHADAVLASQSHVASSGIPQSIADNTLLVPFNDSQALANTLLQYADQVAAIIIEPVAGSMGVIPPQPGYLQEVRRLCTKYNVLLIFDEVLTGLRVAYGGAQKLYNVIPDLTCFGKALGGGMPIGAYGGGNQIMDALIPIGTVYQAGTFSGNPATMAGGIVTLQTLSEPGIYDHLEHLTQRLFDRLRKASTCLKTPPQLQRVGSMFSILFAPHPVHNYLDSQSINSTAYATFFHGMLQQGIYLPPSSVDAACVSAAHTDEDIDKTITASQTIFAKMAASGY